MWGATDSAYVLWMSVRGPSLPLSAKLRLALTVIDMHTSPLITFLISVIAFVVGSWLSPAYYATPEGVFVLAVQNYLAFVFFWIGLATGAIYEWYTGEIVAACRRDGLPGEELLPHSAGVIEDAACAESAAAAAAAVSPAGGARKGAGAAPAPAPARPARARGELENTFDRSPLGTLLRCSPRRVHILLLRLIPWAVGPVIALFYFALPAIVAQTTLMCRNRQRSAHVSPKQSPTSNAAAEPGDFFGADAAPVPALASAPRRRAASPSAAIKRR